MTAPPPGLSAELRAIRAGYGPLEALHAVDLPVPAGCCTLLLGRNGAGRSTALRVLAGTLRPTAGRVLLDGRDATRLGPWRRARLGLCAVPDEQAVFPSLTVAEHLAVSGADPAEVLDRHFPELRRLLDRRAGTLSGGEQRMTALCRALAGPARLLVLDEFGRGLAEEVRHRVFAALAEAVAAGRTVLLAEQGPPPGDPFPPGRCFVHVLHRGRIAFSGEPAELTRQGPGLPPGP
ncbi:ATP-binding cassette domain-containing protein [Phaeacidiphilus oryzae]|uniref:ATP-binding cassette domain-containing protein n=1 Tax=Phaeacidiphilus oryzae TaxID=348818 RepID=UPI00055C6B74|nr:ATP-binding cassette domain-containing protein [Phaeacidiphilus oryzae]